MEDTLGLSLLAFAMFVGCYVAGSIPMACTLSEGKMRFITIVGAGLLVGTSLAVIIPEGIHTMYEDVEKKVEIHHVDEAADAQKDPHVAVNPEEHVHAHSQHEQLHSTVGVSLVLGFVFMLIVDQCAGGHGPSPGDGDKIKRDNMTATLGLVVHAAADGIAMGAAASTSRADVETIVFVAIMLHKAPAAFGLVTFLMHEKFERSRIRKHLFVFAIAAPFTTILTYFGLSQASKEALSSVNATGIAMLFSAGTFLYVATVHVLPEIANMGHSHSHGLPVADAEVLVENRNTVFSKIEIIALVAGCISPLFLSFGHHH
ncbi:zinc transporter ZIP9-B-like [Anneissia japonica]|uniref:zinc transporter ZIP9-B-like n=1 Tax=Anneissia japonica TaxID=1529436 RepID=UPI001425BA2B|nr:zinc transporter ZIP9-B-like [Anneissia japonica]